MNAIRTRAIVLRRTNYGEADRILQLLTHLGKKSVIARGVRREKSRLAGGIELFAICEVVINEGRGELDILTSSKLINFFRHIMDDYDRMQFAYSAIKLVSKSSETTAGSDWYDILAETLAGLDAKTLQFEMVQTWFYLHYSSVLGYELSLWHDVNGQKLLSEQNYIYDITEKGLRSDPRGELTSEHIKLLRLIATRPLKTIAKVGGIEPVVSECLIIAREHAAI